MVELVTLKFFSYFIPVFFLLMRVLFTIWRGLPIVLQGYSSDVININYGINEDLRLD